MDQLNVAQIVASQSKNCKLAHEVICEKNEPLCNQTPLHPKSLDSCCPDKKCNLETLKFSCSSNKSE
jgi:hypothetical protein